MGTEMVEDVTESADPRRPAAIDEQAFREAALAFLRSSAEPRRAAGEFVWGSGSDRVGLFRESDPEQDIVELAAAKAWRAKCYDAGFIWVSGPPAFGGRGMPSSFDRIWTALEAGFEVPSSVFFGIGLGMVAPTILAHARDDVKAQYLPALWRGDVVGCQLFSEPGAGSDLAGITTRAVSDGDEWVISGQKVWTSGAHLSDIGLLLARTRAGTDRHSGLTMFLVDMHSPGIDVRPIRQMTGGSSFNEVFLADVRVPDTLRVGDVDNGWRVALTTLMNERAAVGHGGLSPGFSPTRRLFELARQTDQTDDPLIRQRMAQIWIRTQIARYSRERTAARLRAGQTPGPEASIAKLFMTQTQALVSELATSVNGARLVANSGEWGTYAWTEFILGAPGSRIGGGTDEILRNIVAERVLGLPKV